MFVFVYIPEIDVFLCPMFPSEYERWAGYMRIIELWVLYLVVVYLNLLQMVVVCLKLKQMFYLAASVAAFVAG